MMKNLLLPLLLTVVTLASVSSIQGQCVPDQQYSSPGIYPSDTLPDMTVGTPYTEVVHFVFPNDTVYQGFQVDFDSFTLSSISNIPPGLQWECNANHPQCAYVVVPNQVTRGCVSIYGTPTSMSPAYPAYDSAIVQGFGWITFFGNPFSIAVDIPAYYRTGSGVAINPSFDEMLGLAVTPNPLLSNSVVSYNLPYTSDITIEVLDATGKKVNTIQRGLQSAGYHSLPVSASDLPSGVYFLRFAMDGKYSTTRKLISLN